MALTEKESLGIMSVLLTFLASDAYRQLKEKKESKKGIKTDVKEAQKLAKKGQLSGVTSMYNYGNPEILRDLDEQKIADILKIYKKEASSVYTELFKDLSREKGFKGDYAKYFKGIDDSRLNTGEGWSYPILNWLKGKKHFNQYVKGLESGNIEATGIDAPYVKKGPRYVGGAFETLWRDPYESGTGLIEKQNIDYYNVEPYQIEMEGEMVDNPNRNPYKSVVHRKRGTKGWDLPIDAAEMYLMLQDSPLLTETGEPFFDEATQKKRSKDTIDELVRTIIHEGGHMPGKFLGDPYEMKHTKPILGQRAFLDAIRDATKYSTKDQRSKAHSIIDVMIEESTLVPDLWDDQNGN